MKWNEDAPLPRALNAAPLLLAFTLALILLVPGVQAQSSDSNAAETKPIAETYQSIYLTNITLQSEANEVVNDLRNMIPKAKIYLASSQDIISIHGTADDIALAKKIVVELDHARKVYRLTYTIAESDGGKRIGTQSYSLIAVSGEKTTLKQGTRVPIVTGTTDADKASSQVQYVDVGLHIEANVDGHGEALRLRTKVEQSSLAAEKPGVGQDPVLQQTMLDGEATLTPGKALLLGSLDMPGSTHTEQIEVVSELVR